MHKVRETERERERERERKEGRKREKVYVGRERGIDAKCMCSIQTWGQLHEKVINYITNISKLLLLLLLLQLLVELM